MERAPTTLRRCTHSDQIKLLEVRSHEGSQWRPCTRTTLLVGGELAFALKSQWEDSLAVCATENEMNTLLGQVWKYYLTAITTLVVIVLRSRADYMEILFPLLAYFDSLHRKVFVVRPPRENCRHYARIEKALDQCEARAGKDNVLSLVKIIRRMLASRPTTKSTHNLFCPPYKPK